MYQYDLALGSHPRSPFDSEAVSSGLTDGRLSSEHGVVRPGTRDQGPYAYVVLEDLPSPQLAWPAWLRPTNWCGHHADVSGVRQRPDRKDL